MINTTKLFQTAITHHQAGRLAEAEQAYRDLLKTVANHADAWRLLGGLYLQKQQYVDAIDCFEQAVPLLPNDAEVRTNFALALRGAGHIDDAIQFCEQALRINPAHIPALTNLALICQENGRLVQAMGAYAEIARLQPDHPMAHLNHGNSLLENGHVHEAIAAYEKALNLNSAYLPAQINLGTALSQTGQGETSRHWLNIAREALDKILIKDPQNISAMNDIGVVLRGLNETDAAIDWHQRALRLRPDDAQAAAHLAACQRQASYLDDAHETCHLVLQLKPHSAQAHINLGVSFQDKMNHLEAIKHFDIALKHQPNSLAAQWNKSMSLLALGHYQEGLALHEVGIGIPHLRGGYASSERRWQGESFIGKRLMLWSECGLGDSLQFIRYAQLAKARGGDVIVVCPAPLRPLFRNCPFIDALPDHIEEKDFDLHAPMMSLPYIFGTTLETIPAAVPYLHISDATQAKWNTHFTDTRGYKVGLVWSGDPRKNLLNAHIVDRRRSIGLDLLRPLFNIPNIQFYSLQMGPGAAQIDACGLREHLIDLMPEVKSFEDTGAIIENLDLVISVDTSVVHLAGGLGKPLWVLSRFDACWRWLQNRPDNPWYPSARVFGQPSPGDWRSVVEAVTTSLAHIEFEP